MIDMTKFDFSKFDAAKMFNPDTVLGNLEDQTATATGYITDAKVRDMLSAVNSATFAFARAQTQAAKAYADAVKSAIETHTKK
jgi:hypothetical protein